MLIFWYLVYNLHNRLKTGIWYFGTQHREIKLFPSLLSIALLNSCCYSLNSLCRLCFFWLSFLFHAPRLHFYIYINTELQVIFITCIKTVSLLLPIFYLPIYNHITSMYHVLPNHWQPVVCIPNSSYSHSKILNNHIPYYQSHSKSPYPYPHIFSENPVFSTFFHHKIIIKTLFNFLRNFFYYKYFLGKLIKTLF